MNEFTEEERRNLEFTVCEMESQVSQVTLTHVLSNVINIIIYCKASNATTLLRLE